MRTWEAAGERKRAAKSVAADEQEDDGKRNKAEEWIKKNTEQQQRSSARRKGKAGAGQRTRDRIAQARQRERANERAREKRKRERELSEEQEGDRDPEQEQHQWDLHYRRQNTAQLGGGPGKTTEAHREMRIAKTGQDRRGPPPGRREREIFMRDSSVTRVLRVTPRMWMKKMRAIYQRKPPEMRARKERDQSTCG